MDDRLKKALRVVHKMNQTMQAYRSFSKQQWFKDKIASTDPTAATKYLQAKIKRRFKHSIKRSAKTLGKDPSAIPADDIRQYSANVIQKVQTGALNNQNKLAAKLVTKINTATNVPAFYKTNGGTNLNIETFNPNAKFVYTQAQGFAAPQLQQQQPQALAEQYMMQSEPIEGGLQGNF